jgi:hypothetical protein
MSCIAGCVIKGQVPLKVGEQIQLPCTIENLSHFFDSEKIQLRFVVRQQRVVSLSRVETCRLPLSFEGVYTVPYAGSKHEF